MSISATRTVRELAIEVPGATRVFETLGIDYCCGGAATLVEACAAAGLESTDVVGQLEAASHVQDAFGEEKRWPDERLAALIQFIINKHHVFTRPQLDRIQALLTKVRSVHAQRHPELLEIEGFFNNLKADLTLHMRKEEMILFPYINELEEALAKGTRAPAPMFGTVKNPIRMMRMEHDTAGGVPWNNCPKNSSISVPAGACSTLCTLDQASAALPRDLHPTIPV